MLLFLLFTAPLFSRAAEPNASPPEPPPLRRVQIPPERVPAELERVRQGVLIQLPRAEFEARVRRAARAAEDLKNPPRLVETRYHATLTDRGLAGTGQWKVFNPSGGAGVLPVQPLNLALQQARVQRAGAVTAAAVLGDLDAKAPGLLVEGPGEHSVFFDWTARGEAGAGGVRFDLQVPAAAVASLELKVPADPEVTVEADTPALVSGPHPAETMDRRTWRVEFAGRTQLRLMVRHAPRANGPAPLVLAPLQTRQELGPDVLRAEYKFNLDVTGAGLRAFSLQCDPDLRPYEVEVADLEGWDVTPGVKPGEPATLTVRLRKPFRVGPLVVRCLGPLSAETPWACPAVRLTGALDRGETVVVRVPPNVRLEDWRAGQFRFAPGAAETGGWQTFTLTRSGPAAGPVVARPSARLRVQGPDVRARLLLWWQPGQPAAPLTAQVQYDVARGKVYQLALRLPQGWQADQVRLTSADSLRQWEVVSDQGQAKLLVDLHEGLGPGDAPRQAPAAAQLTVRLRPERPGREPITGRPVPVPRLTPLGAALREGLLGIGVGPAYEAEVKAPAAAAAPDEKGPWGRQSPDFLLAVKGGPVEGQLTLRPRHARLRARCASEVVVSSGRAVVLTRLHLQPEVGSPEFVDVALSAPAVAVREWKTRRGANRVREARRLPAVEKAPGLSVLAARSPLAAACLAVMPPEWAVYRIRFAQPLREPVVLETTYELPGHGAARPPGGERGWHVALPAVAGADPLDGEVALYLGRTDLVRVEVAGLREAAEGARAGAAPPWRVFRYTGFPLALTLRGRGSAADRAPEAAADSAHLTTCVSRDGRLVHHYRVEVRNWPRRVLPVRLPPGAHFLAARADGRWVTRFPPESAPEGAGTFDLPVATGLGRHTFEIIYATDGPAWTLWAWLGAPAPGSARTESDRTWEPDLPVRPVAFRHTWKLPPGVRPLAAERFQQVAGARDVATSPADWAAWFRRFGESASPSRANATPERIERRRHFLAVLTATRQKLARGGKECRLGDLLEQVILDEMQRQEPLIVDATALGGAGLGPETPLAPEADGDPWERLGLEVVPSGPALVLTTRRQAEAWQADGQGGLPEAAIAATGNGTGRWQTLVDWFHTTADPAWGDSDTLPPDNLDWTEWEALAGEGRPAGLVVVRADALPALGVALGLTAALAAWLLRGLPRRLALGLIGVWLLAGGLGMLWLPGAVRPLAWWPAVSGMAVVAYGFFRANAPAASASAVRRGALAAGALALACVPGWWSRAAAPAPATVWLLPGSPENPDRQTVLADPALLEQLDAAGRRGALDPRRAVLTAARYEGAAAGVATEIHAEFQVYCPGDEVATVTLPLGGVQVREALCDGAPGHPRHFNRTGSGGPPEGYSLDVKGKGLHTVLVRFSAAVAARGEDRDLNFSAPELVQSRLTLDLPPGADHPYAVAYRGEHRLAPGETADARGTRLEVDLGRVSTVHVRWHEASGKAQKPVVAVREAYLWDLRPAGSTLSAVLQYTVSRGAVPRLTLDVPEGVEVWNVGVGRLRREEAEESGPRLRQWTLTGTGRQRRLDLEFQRPVTGGVQVVLELVPHRPFGPQTDLPLPVPRGARPPEGADPPSYLAYRVTGMKARVAGHLRVNGIGPGPFASFWREARMGDPGREVEAFSFRRLPQEPPLLRVQLQAPDAAADGLQQLTWTVGRQRADLELTAELHAPDGSITLAEWDVPQGVTVTEVNGGEVRDWSQAGSRLQVWLHEPVRDAELRVSGWKALEPPKPDRNRKPDPNAPATFVVPPLRLASFPRVITQVRVAGAGDVALEAKQLHHLWPLPAPRPTAGAFEYRTDRPDYQGTFLARPDVTAFDARVLTFAEVVGGNLTFHAVVDCAGRRGEPRGLTLRLANWEGDARLEPDGGAGKLNPQGGRSIRTWTVPVPPGAGDRLRVRLGGSVPVRQGVDVLMPEVSVPGASRVERWVAVAGRELRAEDPHGLRPVPDPARALAAWPAEAERVRRNGSAWAVATADWHLRLLPGAAAGSAAPVQVVLAEHTAAVVDGRHWLHEGTYRLFHEAGVDLTLTLPEHARVLSASLDEAEVTPLQPEPNRLWLPLPGAAGAHVLRLQWLIDGPVETPRQPLLDGVKLEGVADYATLGTLALPAGYTLATPAGGAEPSGAAAQDLRRAEAQMQLSGLLAERLRQGGGEAFKAQLSAAQERFYRACRSAKHRSAAAPDLDGRRRELKDRNSQLAAVQGFEAIRARAERQVLDHPAPPEIAPVTPTGSAVAAPVPLRSAGAFQRGTPVYWEMPTPDAAPRVSLVDVSEGRERQAALGSVLLVFLALAAWGVSRFPRAVALVHALWPELLVGLAALGWGLVGANAVSVGLGLVGVISRLMIAGRWVRAAIGRRAATGIAPGSGVSST